MNENTHPLAIIQLKGTQEEMGRQFGEIMKSIGQFEPIFDFYPVMARNLLLGGLPRNQRNFLTKGVTSFLVKLAQNQMKKHRPSEFSKRTIAALETSGLSSKIERELFTMDAFQNAVGVLGAIQMLPELAHWGIGQQPAACTSVAVWGNQSQNGKLYHARNFDFPGVGVWDIRPIVVFCTPKKGLRYGYIACRGADVPGITAFNEAGLTIAFHTRFHKKIGFKGLGVIDFGHTIISEANNIQEAVDIAKKYKINSTWGAIVTNHKEKGSKAAIIETNYGDVDVTYASPGEQSLVNTNHYLSRRMQEGEILAAPTFYHHSLSRYERATQLLKQHKSKGVNTADLENLLDDSFDPTSGQTRTMGSTIRQITSVKSVIMSPQTKKLLVSVGKAPTGSGPYIEIPMLWDSSPGYKILDLSEEKTDLAGNRKSKKSAPKETAIDYYKKAMLINDDPKLGGTNEILLQLEQASRLEKKDPSLVFLRAMLHLENGRFSQASYLLEEAESLEKSHFRKRQSQLWLARTHAASGKKNLAKHMYDRIQAGPGSPLDHVWKKKALADKGWYSPKKLKTVSPNFLLVDANEL